MTGSEKVAAALRGELAQRELTSKQAREFDAVIAGRIDEAVRFADFSSAAVPDFAAVTPDVRQVLTDLAVRRRLAGMPDAAQ